MKIYNVNSYKDLPVNVPLMLISAFDHDSAAERYQRRVGEPLEIAYREGETSRYWIVCSPQGHKPDERLHLLYESGDKS